MRDLPSDQLERVVRAAARGDDAAWRTLIGLFGERVFALLHTNCRDPDLAEEITQSVFVTVHDKLPGYQDTGRFKSWLFQIAMNRLRDEMRRRSRHARPVGGAEALEPLAGGALGYQALDPAVAVALTAALESLPDADHTLIQLRHTAGLSFREVADLLGEPIGTLLARHHRAMGKLRVALESTGIRLEDTQ